MRRRTSRIFSLWPRPEGLGARGGVPMGLHMALSRPDEELYSDPTATRALVSVSLPCPRIPPVVGWSVVALAAAALATGRHLGPGEWLHSPARYIESGADLALVFIGASIGYTLAALWEAGLCFGRLDVAEGGFGIGSKGPSAEPVMWRLGVPTSSALAALVGPLLWSAAVLGWAGGWPALGSGFAMGSGLSLLRVCLPTRPGPLTRLLEPLLRVPDFTTALRYALTTSFLPASQRTAGRRPDILIVGVLSLLGWMIVAGTVLPALVSPDGFARFVVAASTDSASAAVDAEEATDSAEGIEADAPEHIAPGAALSGTVWRVVMSLVGLAVLLWLVESIVRLFRYALSFGGRIEREPVSPSPAARSFWSRESALTRHVPAMAKLPWQWTRATAGTLLVRQGDHDRSFHWLAGGEPVEASVVIPLPDEQRPRRGARPLPRELRHRGNVARQGALPGPEAARRGTRRDGLALDPSTEGERIAEQPDDRLDEPQQHRQSDEGHHDTPHGAGERGARCDVLGCIRLDPLGGIRRLFGIDRRGCRIGRRRHDEPREAVGRDQCGEHGARDDHPAEKRQHPDDQDVRPTPGRSLGGRQERRRQRIASAAVKSGTRSSGSSNRVNGPGRVGRHTRRRERPEPIANPLPRAGQPPPSRGLPPTTGAGRPTPQAHCSSERRAATSRARRRGPCCRFRSHRPRRRDRPTQRPASQSAASV